MKKKQEIWSAVARVSGIAARLCAGLLYAAGAIAVIGAGSAVWMIFSCSDESIDCTCRLLSNACTCVMVAIPAGIVMMTIHDWSSKKEIERT